jgi:hypothetical protein
VPEIVLVEMGLEVVMELEEKEMAAQPRPERVPG